MRIHNVHERVLDAPAEEVQRLLEDLDRVWPEPPPTRDGSRLRLDPTVWQELERRPGERAAFRIVEPDEFRAEHWLEVEPLAGGRTMLRHTLDGEVVGSMEDVWRDGLRAGHDAYIEALLDRAEEAVR